MKAKYLFSLVAMSVMMAACSNEDDLSQLSDNSPKQSDGIHFKATIGSKGNTSEATRALTEEGNKIVAEWQVGEELLLSYNVEGETEEVSTVATVSAVDPTTGAATIEAELDENVKNNTPVNLVYPRNYNKYWYGDFGLEDFFLGGDLVAGFCDLPTVSSDMDARRGTGTIISRGDEATLDGPVSLAPLFAICKFTFLDENNQPLNITRMEIINATTNDMIKLFNPLTCGPDLSYYVPMPSLDGVSVRFRGSDGTDYYKATATATLEVGKFYRPTVKMTKIPAPVPLSAVTEDHLGFVINQDGIVYPPGTEGQTIIAMIGYVGGPGSADTSNPSDNWRGLAVGLAAFDKSNMPERTDKDNTFSWSFDKKLSYSISEVDALLDLRGISNTQQMPKTPEENFSVTGYSYGWMYPLGWALSRYAFNAPDGTSGWFIPAAGQWVKVLNAFGAHFTNTLQLQGQSMLRPDGLNVDGVFSGYPGGRFRTYFYSLTDLNFDNGYYYSFTSTRAESYNGWACAYRVAFYHHAPYNFFGSYCKSNGNAFPFFAFR